MQSYCLWGVFFRKDLTGESDLCVLRSTAYKCLKAFFFGTRVFKNAQTRCLSMLKEASDILSTR